MYVFYRALFMYRCVIHVGVSTCTVAAKTGDISIQFDTVQTEVKRPFHAQISETGRGNGEVTEHAVNYVFMCSYWIRIFSSIWGASDRNLEIGGASRFDVLDNSSLYNIPSHYTLVKR